MHALSHKTLSEREDMAGDEEAVQLLGAASTSALELDTSDISQQGGHRAASWALQAGCRTWVAHLEAPQAIRTALSTYANRMWTDDMRNPPAAPHRCAAACGRR